MLDIIGSVEGLWYKSLNDKNIYNSTWLWCYDYICHIITTSTVKNKILLFLDMFTQFFMICLENLKTCVNMSKNNWYYFCSFLVTTTYNMRFYVLISFSKVLKKLIFFFTTLFRFFKFSLQFCVVRNKFAMIFVL